MHGGQRMHDRRLMLAGDHDAGALVVLQVARDRAEPLVDIVIVGVFGPCAMPSEIASAQANSSTSPARSGRRWSALVPVGVGIGSTTYSRFIVSWCSPTRRRLRELARVAQAAPDPSQEIGVQRNHDIGVR